MLISLKDTYCTLNDEIFKNIIAQFQKFVKRRKKYKSNFN